MQMLDLEGALNAATEALDDVVKLAETDPAIDDVTRERLRNYRTYVQDIADFFPKMARDYTPERTSA